MAIRSAGCEEDIIFTKFNAICAKLPSAVITSFQSKKQASCIQGHVLQQYYNEGYYLVAIYLYMYLYTYIGNTK